MIAPELLKNSRIFVTQVSISLGSFSLCTLLLDCLLLDLVCSYDNTNFQSRGIFGGNHAV